MKKRLLALCLVLCMVLGMLPVTALAAETTNTADFNTVSKTNTSYTKVTTTAGWVATNSAIFQGGTTNASPTFTAIGPDSSYKAPCLNGKTSAVGTITSPTLTGGISALSFTYANVFGESNGVDVSISIKVDGTEVASSRLDNNSVTKFNAYTYEWTLDTPVEGDFTIFIKNNSPSNSTSNKDRVVIANLSWTSYAGSSEECAHENTTETEAIEPDCVNVGYTAGVYCNECEEYIEGHEEIAALGHTATDEGVATAPTCTAAGYTTHVCSVCSETYTVAGEAALGHSYNEGEVTKEATCKANGSVLKTCTVCSATKTETTPVAHTLVDGVCSVCCVVDGLETGVPYKWGMYHASKKAVYYFNGSMSGYYGATSTDVTKAVDIYLEEADGGYYITFTNSSGVKQYINLVASGSYVNFKIQTTATSVYTFDSVAKTMVTQVNGTDYYIGTYGTTYTTFSTSKTSFITGSSAKNIDISQYPAHFYQHAYNFSAEVTDPTCAEAGYTTYTCNCGLTRVDDEVAALPHTWVDATFEAPKTCSTCGATEGEALVAVASVNDVKYESLAEAVAAAEDGDTVTLLGDATGAGVVIDKDLTIDLGGYTYTFNQTVGSTGTTTLGLQILEGNTVSIENGTLTSTATVEGSKEVKVLIQNYADLTLVDVNLVDNTEHILYALSNNSGYVSLEGSTSITTDAVAIDSCKYASYEVPTVVIDTTGTIAGTIEVTGGNLELNAGNFTGALTYTSGNVIKADDVVLAAPEGYKWVDGVLTAIVYVAEVNGVKYESLAEAVEAAEAGATVTLLGDATGAGVVIDKDITIDLGGYTYTFNQTVGSTGTTTLGLQILKDNNVTIKNGTLTSTAVVEGKEVKVLIQNYANLTLTDVNLVDNTEHILYALSNNSGEIVLNGNTNITTDAVAFDVYDYSSAGYTVPSMTVNTTGTITGEIEVSDTASLAISGGTFSTDVSDYCAEGYIVTENDGVYTVSACEHSYFYDCDKVCEICGAIDETRGHTVEHVAAVAATCTENGNLEYWYCTICGSAWTDEAQTQVTNLMSVITPAAHTYTDNCDSECDVCYEYRWDTPHGELTHVEAVVPANCQEKGCSEYWVCQDCGAFFGDAEASYEVNPAWMSYYGEHSYVHGACEHCGEANYTYTVYFENNWLWTDVCAYIWFEDGTSVVAWPGAAMELYGTANGHELYVVQVPYDAVGLIFNGIKNDGSGSRDQSPDIKGGWYDGIIYSMNWDNGNQVATTDMSAFVAKDDNNNLYTSLSAAVAGVEEGGTIYMMNSVELSSFLTINKSLTLDLCGCSITREDGTALYINAPGAVVNLQGGTVSGGLVAVWVAGGTVNINDGYYYDLGNSPAVYAAGDGVVVNIYGGEFYTSEMDGNQYWVLNIQDDKDAEINVYGGYYANFDPANNLSEGANTNFVAQCHVSAYDEWFGMYYVYANHTYTYECDKVCSVCYELTNEWADHWVTHVDAVAATCTAYGNIEYWYCEYCGTCWDNAECTGMPLNQMSVKLPMAEHEYFYACDPVCMNCYEETNPEATHTVVHVEAVAATCTAYGNIEYWYCSDCGTCWDNAECTGMPLNQMSVKLPMAEHEYFYACDTHCMNCGELTNENAAHTIVHVEAKEATCQETGNIEYWYCSDCGGAWSDENLRYVTNQMSVKTYKDHEYFYACDPVCMNCYELTNPDATHTVVHVDAVAGDCLTMGNIEYWYCSDCGTCWDNAECTGMPLNKMSVKTGYGDHNYVNHVCSICGARELFDIDGANMTLGNSLAMNFYILPSDLVEGETYYAVITKEYADGRAAVTVTVEQADWTWHTGYGEWYVSFNGVAAKEMTDTITVVVYNSADEQVSNVWVDSVQAYTMRVLLKEEAKASPNAEKLTLYVDMLNYGAAAQVEFKYNTENLANNQLTEAQAAYATSDDIELTDNRVKGEGYSATNLTLESDITMNFFFLASAIPTEHDDYYAIATWTDHYGNAKEVRVEGEDFAQLTNDTDWYVAVKGVVVADARQLVTVTVYNAAGEAVATGTDSIESYVARNVDKKAIYLAIMKFCVSAYESFH